MRGWEEEDACDQKCSISAVPDDEGPDEGPMDSDMVDVGLKE